MGRNLRTGARERERDICKNKRNLGNGWVWNSRLFGASIGRDGWEIGVQQSTRMMIREKGFTVVPDGSFLLVTTPCKGRRIKEERNSGGCVCRSCWIGWQESVCLPFCAIVFCRRQILNNVGHPS